MMDRRFTTFLNRATPPNLATLVIMAGVSALSMSVFLPSLNSMTVFFDAPYALVQLSVSGYLAAIAIAQLVIGPLADKYGRRPVVLACFAIFMIASLGAALSQNIYVFLAFRIAQSVVAAGMILSRAIIRDIVPSDQAASLIGYATMAMSIVPMIGPSLGGILDEGASWQASFYLLAASGLFVIVLCYFDQGETLRDGGLSFKAQFQTYPELLRSQRFWGYAICAAMASGAFFALLGGAAYVAETVYHLTPAQTGLALGAPSIGYAVGNGLSGRYSVRYGINQMALIGTLITSAGLLLSVILSGIGFDSALVFFGFCSILGLGNGLTLPNTSAGLMSVRPRLAGTASGLGGSLMIGGGAILSAFAGLALSGGTSAMPLQLIMLISALFSVLAIVWVIRREFKLAGE